MTSKEVVAFVPIKRHSERVPNKNFLAFDSGEPLLRYILTTLAECAGIQHRYLYCSDPSVSMYMPPSFSFMQEPSELSSASITSVIHDFVSRAHARVYVLAHTTAPFLEAATIELALSKVIDGEYDSALTVVSQQAFMWQGGKPLNFDPTNIPRSQDLEPVFVETTGLYVFTRELFMKTNRRVGDHPYLLEVPLFESIDINERDDFLLANAIFQNKLAANRSAR
jgi:CMP-N-acetylneuraminic acid synthetase